MGTGAAAAARLAASWLCALLSSLAHLHGTGQRSWRTGQNHARGSTRRAQRRGRGPRGDVTAGGRTEAGRVREVRAEEGDGNGPVDSDCEQGLFL